jgi:hypothetical protein
MNPQRLNVALVVIAFLLVVGLIMGVLPKLRTAADYQETVDHLKDLTLATHACNDAHKKLPPAFDRFQGITYPASVHVHLLPYVKEDDLYKGFLKEGEGDVSAQVFAFQAPNDASIRSLDGVQNFPANLRVFADKGMQTLFHHDMPALAVIEPGTANIPRTFLDGTSNTIAFATKLAECGAGGSRYSADPTSPWAAYMGQNAARGYAHPAHAQATFQLGPRADQCLVSPLMAQSFTRDGISLSLFDGSVRRVARDIDPTVWNLAMQPNDGEAF